MKSKSAIAMDGVNCVKTQDGNVAFKKRTFSTWLVIVLLGLFLLFIIAGIVAILFSERDIDAKLLIGAIAPCIFLAAVIVALIRRLRIPSVYINATSRMLEIGRGVSAQQIPFSRLSHIAAVPRLGPMQVLIIDILAILDDGDKIQFGSVSGAEEKARTRANAVAQLVADTIGTQIRQ